VEPVGSRHPGPMKATMVLTARVIDLEAKNTAPCCPLCEQLLNLHQPDESLPNQLLATCDSCLRWYCLFGMGEDSNQFFMLGLPDKSMIEEARFTNGLDDQE
jgi:hypothetical protein